MSIQETKSATKSLVAIPAECNMMKAAGRGLQELTMEEIKLVSGGTNESTPTTAPTPVTTRTNSMNMMTYTSVFSRQWTSVFTMSASVKWYFAAVWSTRVRYC